MRLRDRNCDLCDCAIEPGMAHVMFLGYTLHSECLSEFKYILEECLRSKMDVKRTLRYIRVGHKVVLVLASIILLISFYNLFPGGPPALILLWALGIFFFLLTVVGSI